MATEMAIDCRQLGLLAVGTICSIDFEFATEAVVWCSQHGGRLLWSTERAGEAVRWFPMGVTMTEIIKRSESYGSRSIGNWKEAAAELLCKTQHVEI